MSKTNQKFHQSPLDPLDPQLAQKLKIQTTTDFRKIKQRSNSVDLRDVETFSRSTPGHGLRTSQKASILDASPSSPHYRPTQDPL